MTTLIKQADLIESVAAALQYISYYHPADYIAHLARAYEREQSPAAKDAIAQILTNSKMSATGHRPICQDTGIVNVFLEIGMDVKLDGSGPTYLEAPSLDLWPNVGWTADTEKSQRVDLNTLTPEQVAAWKPGQTLLLNGKMLTGRDAAHKRIQDMLAKGEKLPVDFTNRVIYYVGPVDPVGDEAVGPAGPTTATRMDGFTEMMLAKTGLIAMIGKAERGPVAIEAIKKHKSAYLMAVGGAAYLVSKAIKHAKVVGFADMGMEAIYEFDVVDMPVTVAVDAGGTSAHITGPAEWQKRIATGEFKGIGVNAG